MVRSVCFIVVFVVLSLCQFQSLERYVEVQPVSMQLSLSSIGVGIHVRYLNYVKHVKVETLIIVQIETRAAVDRAKDILAVDACMIGPNDLSLSKHEERNTQKKMDSDPASPPALIRCGGLTRQLARYPDNRSARRAPA